MRNPKLFEPDYVHQDDGSIRHFYGTDITLRDLLAGMHMAAIVASKHDEGARMFERDAAEDAMRAVTYTDALLAALEKKE